MKRRETVKPRLEAFPVEQSNTHTHSVPVHALVGCSYEVII